MPQQRILGLRRIGRWSENPKELSRQLKEFEDNLFANFGDLLAIVDGTGARPVELPVRDKLEFRGNVRLRSRQDRNIVEVIDQDIAQEPVTASGLDGVDATAVDQAVTVRASRDAITASISTTQNPLNPTGWNTADHLLLTLTASSTIQSLGTLDASGTRLKRITNVSTGSFTATFQHSTTLRCPAFVNFSLSPGSSVWVYNENGTTEWRVLSVYVQPGITDHGNLTGLDDPNDHAWAILVDGTRPFTGDQSMGDNDLTNWNRLIATDALSTINLSGGDLLNTSIIDMVGDGWLDMNGGDILAVDDITAAGSGSIWDLSGGTLVNPSLIQLQNSSSAIDANGGKIREVHSIDFESSPIIGTPSSGYDRMGVRAGVPAFLVGTETHCWDVPIRSQTGATITSAVNYDTSLTNILGQDFGQGSFMITSEYLLVPDTESENNIAYGERREWWLWRNDGTNDWEFTLIGESQAWDIGASDMGPWIVVPSMTSDSNLRFTVNPWTHGATYAWRVLISAVAR